MSTADELKAVLLLQNEIELKQDELIKRIIPILQANKTGRIIATIDGELYELGRVSLTTQAIESCRKYDGFFSEYRLIKLEPIK